MAESKRVKRKAVEELYERSSKIKNFEISLDGLNILDTKDIHLIRNNIHTARMSKYPRLPKTLLQFYITAFFFSTEVRCCLNGRI